VRFLLDMGLGQSTARFLRQQGYEAVHLRDQGLQRVDDTVIIEKACAGDRIVLTHDLDFGRVVALSGQHIPSVITFRLSDMCAVNVNRHLAEVLLRFAEHLTAGALVSVTDRDIRVRRLPVNRRAS